MKKKYLFIAFITCCINYTQILKAQVTIGSLEAPVQAAILDIKDQMPDSENITSTTGGVVMPRLKLKNISTLEPFIANDDSDIIELKKSHIGLMIYNLEKIGQLDEGLYVWNGNIWEPVISPNNSIGSVTITTENGLNATGGVIKLGGVLDGNTHINHDENFLNFQTGTGIFVVDDNTFTISEDNIGIGKTPVAGTKLGILGDAKINGNLTVGGSTILKDTQITGAQFTYNPSTRRKKNKFLRAINNQGEASWQSLGGLMNPEMEPLPTNVTIFDPSDVSENYNNTGLSVELSSGRWLISYSVRVMNTNPLTSGSTAAIRPSTLRFTMLDNQGNPTVITEKKPYDDNRIYPDVSRNVCTGFIVVNNSTETDQIYTLGVKVQEAGGWIAGRQVEVANKRTNDAYVIALFLNEE